MIKLPAYLSGFSSRTDGSAGIRMTTQELQPGDFTSLQGALNQFGWFIFAENDVQDEEIPDDDAEENKRPSQRIRNVLYRLWEQGGKQGTFESYYRERMEQLIDLLKKKLD
jgi:hypothetical protein